MNRIPLTPNERIARRDRRVLMLRNIIITVLLCFPMLCILLLCITNGRDIRDVYPVYIVAASSIILALSSVLLFAFLLSLWNKLHLIPGLNRYF